MSDPDDACHTHNSQTIESNQLDASTLTSGIDLIRDYGGICNEDIDEHVEAFVS
jgi:hypothetical protein